MHDRQVFAALLQFHLRSGLRVAMRALVPIFAAVSAAVVLYGNPLVVLGITRALFLPDRPAAGAAVLAALALISLTASSVQRLTRGLGGWARHLPASGIAQRHAACVGLALTQAPLLLLLVVTTLALPPEQLRVSLLRLAGLPLLAWASAMTVLRIRRTARVCAAAAAIAAALGAGWALLTSLLLVVISESCAGSIRAPRPRRRRRSPVTRSLRLGRRHTGRLPGAARLWWTVSGQALAWRLPACWLLTLLVLVPARLFLANNPLAPELQAGVLRLAGLVAATVVMAALCDTLVKRRPPWPWTRSLPWSSALRAGLDAVMLLVLTLPVILLVTWALPSALLPALTLLPWLALRGAVAIRGGSGRTSGATGQLLGDAVVPVALVALLPWTALLALLTVPLAARQAAVAEQRQDVSRWHELHHLAAGDSLSWSDS